MNDTLHNGHLRFDQILIKVGRHAEMIAEIVIASIPASVLSESRQILSAMRRAINALRARGICAAGLEIETAQFRVAAEAGELLG